jgi:hypothetical protein
MRIVWREGSRPAGSLSPPARLSGYAQWPHEVRQAPGTRRFSTSLAWGQGQGAASQGHAAMSVRDGQGGDRSLEPIVLARLNDT